MFNFYRFRLVGTKMHFTLFAEEMCHTRPEDYYPQGNVQHYCRCMAKQVSFIGVLGSTSTKWR